MFNKYYCTSTCAVPFGAQEGWEMLQDLDKMGAKVISVHAMWTVKGQGEAHRDSSGLRNTRSRICHEWSLSKFYIYPYVHSQGLHHSRTERFLTNQSPSTEINDIIWNKTK